MALLDSDRDILVSLISCQVLHKTEDTYPVSQKKLKTIHGGMK